jgi:hypothetical protein
VADDGEAEDGGGGRGLLGFEVQDLLLDTADASLPLRRLVQAHLPNGLLLAAESGNESAGGRRRTRAFFPLFLSCPPLRPQAAEEGWGKEREARKIRDK